MTSATTTARPTSYGPGLAPFAAAGVALSAVLTTIGTFSDASENNVLRREFVTLGIILAVAAATFWVTRRAIIRAHGDADRTARAGVVMAIVAFLSLIVFWAGLPSVLAAGATALAFEAHSRRAGYWGRGPVVTLALSGLTVLLACVAAFIG